MKSLEKLYKIGHGPSSSHTMGPEEACKYILEKYPSSSKIVVTLFGSLSLTGKGHLTDRIIHETLKNVEHEIIFDNTFDTTHPNTLRFDIYKDNKLIDTVKIASIGGGSISINGKINEEKEVYPFKSFAEIKKYCIENNMSLADIVYNFDSANIKDYLLKVYDTMLDSIDRGIKTSGELPGGLHVQRKAHTLFDSESNNEVVDVKQIRLVSSYAFAVSEENASGGIIVTAPTCGSCGVLPAILSYYQKRFNIDNDKIIDALAVAGLIGNLIKTNASISGALAGCQSEIGSACSMAAAAVAMLDNCSIEEIEYAAEIALEHHLGLTCDPINGLVQIPCIERNAVAALRAIDAANLAKFLNGTRKISLDLVIQTMYETGKDLNSNYKETSIGGLAKNYRC